MKNKLILGKQFKGSLGNKDFKKIKQLMSVYSEKQAQQKLKAETDLANFDVERDLNLLSHYDEVLEKIALSNKLPKPTISNTESARKTISTHETNKMCLKMKKKLKKTAKKNELKRSRTKIGGSNQKKKTKKRKGSNKMPAQYLYDQQDLINKMKCTIKTQTRKLGSKAQVETACHTFGMRKAFDVVKSENDKKILKVRKLEKELKLLNDSKYSLQSDSNSCDHKVKSLKMQLDTVLIHNSEMSENTHTYESDLAFMIEEKMERAWNMESIKKEMQEVKALCSKVESTARGCDFACEQTEESLIIFQHEMKTFRKFFNRRIKDLKLISKNSKKKKKRKKKKSGKIPSVRDRNRRQNISSMEDQLHTIETKITYYEGLFVDLNTENGSSKKQLENLFRSAGVYTVEKLIRKHGLRNDVRRDLQEDIIFKKIHKEKLWKEIKHLQTDLEEVHDNQENVLWEEVDKAESKCEETLTFFDKSLKRSGKRIVDLLAAQHAITNIFIKIKQATNSRKKLPEYLLTMHSWSPENFTEAFKILSQLMLHLEKIIQKSKKENLVKKEEITDLNSTNKHVNFRS